MKSKRVKERLERRKQAHGKVSPARKAPGSNKKVVSRRLEAMRGEL